MRGRGGCGGENQREVKRRGENGGGRGLGTEWCGSNTGKRLSPKNRESSILTLRLERVLN